MNDELLSQFQASEFFKPVMEDLQQHRPQVPMYAWNKEGNNLEEMRAKSLLQQGFDLAITFLTT